MHRDTHVGNSFVEVIGWFAVGVFKNDRAMMLIHIIAPAEMIAGMSSG